eukprot:snap_masked-scaffold_3-processed-gene-12.32-mRNA-1 protein AED:1.00 eAED:1.00 QI:0/0/0/0/1/1/2/0/70
MQDTIKTTKFTRNRSTCCELGLYPTSIKKKPETSKSKQEIMYKTHTQGYYQNYRKIRLVKMKDIGNLENQ